jgi:hypothetical protein
MLATSISLSSFLGFMLLMRGVSPVMTDRCSSFGTGLLDPNIPLKKAFVLEDPVLLWLPTLFESLYSSHGAPLSRSTGPDPLLVTETADPDEVCLRARFGLGSGTGRETDSAPAEAANQAVIRCCWALAMVTSREILASSRFRCLCEPSSESESVSDDPTCGWTIFLRTTPVGEGSGDLMSIRLFLVY